MPIVFQQPEPFAPQISMAYGAAEQGRAAQAQMAQLYAAQGQMTHQARQAQADRESAGNAANYRNLQTALLAAPEAEVARGRLQLARQAHQDSLMPTEADAFQAHAAAARQQAAFQQQQQMAELEASLQRQALTHREEIRLQQQKTALAEVQTDPLLSKEEKQAVSLMLKTGIDPLEVRQRNAQLETRKLQMEQQKQAMAFQTALMEGSGAQMAAAIQKRIVNIPDGQGGVTQGWVDFEGRLNEIPRPKEEKVKMKSEAEIHKEAKEIAEARHPATTVSDQGKEVLTSELLAARAQELPKVVAELRAEQQAANTITRGTRTGGAPSPIAEGAQAFNPEGDTLTQAQRNLVAVYKADLAQIEGNNDVDKPIRVQTATALKDAFKILTAHGHPDLMSPPVRERYFMLLRLAETGKPRPPAPAAPAATAQPAGRRDYHQERLLSGRMRGDY